MLTLLVLFLKEPSCLSTACVEKIIRLDGIFYDGCSLRKIEMKVKRNDDFVITTLHFQRIFPRSRHFDPYTIYLRPCSRIQ